MDGWALFRLGDVSPRHEQVTIKVFIFRWFPLVFAERRRLGVS